MKFVFRSLYGKLNKRKSVYWLDLGCWREIKVELLAYFDE